MRKLLLLVVIQSLVFSWPVFAQGPKEPPPINSSTVTMSKIGDQGIYGIVHIIQKFGGWLLLVAGACAVVMIIWGGIRYMISMGNPQQTEGAKKTIIYALVGLIVIVLSYSIVGFVIAIFTSQPQTVKDITKKIESGEVQGKVSQCQWNGKTVYNILRAPQGPDDFTSELVDADGKFICFTSGGFTGKGDLSACSGFDPSQCPAQ